MIIGRRQWVQTLAAIGCVSYVESRLAGQQFARSDFDAIYTAEVDKAIQKGLEFLCDQQTESGSFETEGWGSNAAVCSLAGIAMLSRGIRPEKTMQVESREGKCLHQIGKFILGCCTESGFVESPGRSSHGPMYEHAFATLFLAEFYGTTTDSNVRESLEGAVDVILSSQNNEGGWRYDPRPSEADLSVTVCQLMALRAAKNTGIYVPLSVIEQGLRYVRQSQNSDGGFMYRLSGGESRLPLTAAAIVALNSAGVYSGSEIDAAFGYLNEHGSDGPVQRSNSYFYYFHYYAMQAYWNRGGEPFANWFSRASRILLREQKSDGSWQDYHSPEFGTAMACIVLNMPRTVLPIFEK